MRAASARAGLRRGFTASDPRNIPIADLNLPTYLQTVLRNGGPSTARDLAALTEDDLCTVPGVAGMSIRKIKMALLEHGLSLRPPGGGGYRGASKPAN